MAFDQQSEENEVGNAISIVGNVKVISGNAISKVGNAISIIGNAKVINGNDKVV